MVGLARTFIPHRPTQRGTHVTDDQTVWPAPEALNLATAVIRRGYVLPETMEHPIIKFESYKPCVLVVAWGLAPTAAATPSGEEDSRLLICSALHGSSSSWFHALQRAHAPGRCLWRWTRTRHDDPGTDGDCLVADRVDKPFPADRQTLPH